MNDDPAARFRENVTEVAATVVTGLWLAALLTGQSWWLAVLLVGYLVVVPLVALLYGDEADRAEWWDDDWSGWDDWWGSSDEADATADASSANADAEPTPNRAGESDRTPGDALETLRDRYASGDLTDDQFERKLERLLETETLEDAADRARTRSAVDERRAGRAGGAGNATEPAGDDRPLERDLEYES